MTVLGFLAPAVAGELLLAQLARNEAHCEHVLCEIRVFSLVFEVIGPRVKLPQKPQTFPNPTGFGIAVHPISKTLIPRVLSTTPPPPRDTRIL